MCVLELLQYKINQRLSHVFRQLDFKACSGRKVRTALFGLVELTCRLIGGFTWIHWFLQFFQ